MLDKTELEKDIDEHLRCSVLFRPMLRGDFSWDFVAPVYHTHKNDGPIAATNSKNKRKHDAYVSTVYGSFLFHFFLSLSRLNMLFLLFDFR